MKTLIIDCDPGNGVPGANVDDGLALALALRSPQECTVAAITTVTGNTPNFIGKKVAEAIVQFAGADVPVYAGASRALIEDTDDWEDWLTRSSQTALLEELWHGVPMPAPKTGGRQQAVAKLVELVTHSPGEITIVALGPLTNIALAMRLSDTFAQNVAKIVIMGGVFQLDGYLTDTNFALDPEAARIVLSSNANIQLVPLDVTTKTMFTLEDLDTFARTDDELAQYIARTSTPWVQYSQRVRGLPGMWVHDALAVVAALQEGFLDVREYVLDIELAGASRGRTLRWPAFQVPGQPHTKVPDWKPVRVSESVDNEALVALLTERICQ